MVASSLLGGCPIYPADSCYSANDCSAGYTCDSYLGQCVANPPGDDDDDNVTPPAPPPGPPVPPPRDRTCFSPAECEAGETCGEQGFCLPGDCSFWGCVEGFSCVESPEGRSYACVESEAPPPPEGVCTGGTVDAPAVGTLFLVDDRETLSFCLGGLASDPSTGLVVTGGELGPGAVGAEPFQQASLTIKGVLDSRSVIECNPVDDFGDVSFCGIEARTLGLGQTEYVTSGEPFTILVDSWTDTAFVGTALGVPFVKTVFFSGRPGSEQTAIVSDLKIEVRSTVFEDDGSGNGDGDEGGGRPPPP
ncbi:MAG TPA: hypothetical protein VFS00_10090 [Polyangiaceae bacterium]|nr:hypothetical protein [Polyangiaceae bacterium]